MGNCIEDGNKTRSDSASQKSAVSRKKAAKFQKVTIARKATLKSHNEPSIKVMFSNADQLTSPKMCALQTKIQQEHPMIAAICEVKPKNAVKDGSDQDYKIPDYSLHPVNLSKSIVQITSDELLEVRSRGGDIMLFACCYRSPTYTSSSEVIPCNIAEEIQPPVYSW